MGLVRGQHGGECASVILGVMRKVSGGLGMETRRGSAVQPLGIDSR
jgi:hypothetical protein